MNASVSRAIKGGIKGDDNSNSDHVDRHADRAGINNDFEFKKACAARFVQGRLFEPTPSGKWTWRRWWEVMFDDDDYDNYREYIARMGRV